MRACMHVCVRMLPGHVLFGRNTAFRMILGSGVNNLSHVMFLSFSHEVKHARKHTDILGALKILSLFEGFFFLCPEFAYDVHAGIHLCTERPTHGALPGEPSV